MELRHLRYFIALCESLHFRHASATLGISQPSLSQQLRQLEEELQTSLLRRTKRHVELTEAGRLFLDEARHIVARADRAAMIARRVGGQDGGRVRVGVGYCMDQVALAKAVSVFSTAHPNVRIELQTMSVARQVAALRDERLDVALVRHQPTERSLASDLLYAEQLIVALPPGHRLTARPVVALSSLAHEPFVLTSRDRVPVYHDIVLKTCREAGFVPNAIHEVDHLHMLVGLVASGCGVALVPAFVQRTRPRRVAFASLRPASNRLQTVALWRAARTSDMLEEFVAVVKKALLPPAQRVATGAPKKRRPPV